MWVLQLNDMRSNKSEYLSIAASGKTKEDLLTLIANEMVTPWRDGGYENGMNGSNYTYTKFFKKGGVLEWFNPPSSINQHFIDFDLYQTQQRQNILNDYPMVKGG